MKTFETFLLEYIRNPKNTKYFIRRAFRALQALEPRTFTHHVEFNDARVWKLDCQLRGEYETQATHIIQALQRELLKDQTYLYYKVTHSYGSDIDLKVDKTKTWVTYYLYVKNVHFKRVRPTAVVYHTSYRKHQASILDQGLLPMENLNFWDSTPLHHPPMIFATLTEPQWMLGPGKDIWEIDTRVIDNKWWLDPNSIGAWKGDEMICTFDAIPPTAITLVNEKFKAKLT